MRLFRQLAVVFLRSTARGNLVEALPRDEAGPRTTFIRALGLPALFKAVGRGVGKVLPASTKARIQDYLINRYRIPVDLQRDRGRLRECLRAAFRLQRDRAGESGVGDYLEFGVYQGNSLLEVHRVTEEEGLPGVRIFGFDSFEGLPQEAEEEGVWSAGQYRSDLAFTRQRLTEGGVDWSRTTLVPGFFCDTLTPTLVAEHSLSRVGVIMIDCDLYSSAREALEFCTPLIRDSAVVLFDDWGSTGPEEGEQRAFSEFLASLPDLEAEPLESYDAAAAVFALRRRSATAGAR
jgi:hypothetical protein